MIDVRPLVAVVAGADIEAVVEGGNELATAALVHPLTDGAVVRA